MNALDVQLKALVNCLASQNIDYVILGGIAVSLYGEPRFTVDIDVNIILDKRDISVFLKKSREYGLFPVLANTQEIAKKCGVIPLNFKKGKTAGKFDMVIAENPLEFTAIKRGRIKMIGSIKARFVTPEDLIIHKITSPRPRDFEDLKGILIRRKGKLDLKYIRYWLGKIDRANKRTHLWRLFKKLAEEL